MSLKNPVTPQGIDPGIVRLVSQRLNHYATPGYVTVGVLCKLTAFCEAESPGSSSQNLATDPYAKPSVSSISSPVSFRFIFILFLRICGRDVVVGVATHNGLDCSGFDPWRGKILSFAYPPRPALGPTQPPTRWVTDIFSGLKAAGA
jgi:hypothetical protein